MAHTSPFAATLGLAAALSLTNPATAAAASTAAASGPQSAVNVSLPGPGYSFSTSAYDPQADIGEWRRCGWYGCYRRGWRGHHRGGVSAGEVIAGVAIIGGIAAIAAAATKDRRREPDVVVVERDRRPDTVRYDTRRDAQRRDSAGGSGIDSAVSQCLRAIERDVRVESVDNASRLAQGWVVTGTIFDGSGFSCEIGNDGRIADVSYGRFRGSGGYGAPGSSAAGPSAAGSSATGSAAPGQWSDQRYADARAALGNARFTDIETGRPAEPLVDLSAGQMPAYPGGPLPGEE